MRDLMLLGTRLVLGSYLAVHGTQKLFGAFGGPGLDRAGAGFERIGLTPGKPMAALAGATELGGGLLTAAGAADPAGPLAIIGAMTVASATHRASGPLAANRGFELPLTNLAAAAALAAAGPGRFRIGPPLSRRLTTAAVAGGALLAAGSLAKMLTAGRGQAPPAGPVSSPAQAGADETGAR
jgi:putative oxidoreductase